MKLLDKIFIWLSMCEMDIGTLYGLVSTYADLEELWTLDKYEGKITYRLTSREFGELMKFRQNGALDRIIAELDGGNSKIKYVCMYQDEYPQSLRELDFPPFVLYYVGNWSLIGGRNVGIVGSRVCTRYGREQTERFARDLCDAGFCIVSGLSEGIDAVAHDTAVKHGGKTIAVVANGLKMIYPAINTNLAREIAKTGGLLVTEFHPEYIPKRFAFVRRNRIIAALCEAVLVTEARKDSGALHTVNFATDLSREVFALPGNCNSTASQGTNDLIKHFWSTCVTEPEEIIGRLNENVALCEIIHQTKRPISRVDRVMNLKEEEACVLEIVKNEDAHIDEIAKSLNFDTKKLLGLLTLMEIRGLIKKLPGNFYARKE